MLLGFSPTINHSSLLTDHMTSPTPDKMPNTSVPLPTHQKRGKTETTVTRSNNAGRHVGVWAKCQGQGQNSAKPGGLGSLALVPTPRSQTVSSAVHPPCGFLSEFLTQSSNGVNLLPHLLILKKHFFVVITTPT